VLSRLARQPVKGDGSEASFTEITEAAAEMLEAERVSVWLFEADRNAICVADLFDRVEDRHEAGERLSREAAPAYFAALADERALAIDDVQSDPRTAQLRSYWERHRISAMLDAPIRAGGEFVGVVCFEHIGPPHHWTIEEVGFAGSIVDLAAIALESAHRRRAELSMSFLAEAASILSSSLDYRKTIGNVADLTVPALADWCAVDVIEEGEIRRIATRHSLAGRKNCSGARETVSAGMGIQPAGRRCSADRRGKVGFRSNRGDPGHDDDRRRPPPPPRGAGHPILHGRAAACPESDAGRNHVRQRQP
jgi:hypothetical protein